MTSSSGSPSVVGALVTPFPSLTPIKPPAARLYTLVANAPSPRADLWLTPPPGGLAGGPTVVSPDKSEECSPGIVIEAVLPAGVSGSFGRSGSRSTVADPLWLGRSLWLAAGMWEIWITSLDRRTDRMDERG